MKSIKFKLLLCQPTILTFKWKDTIVLLKAEYMEDRKGNHIDTYVKPITKQSMFNRTIDCIWVAPTHRLPRLITPAVHSD